MNEVGEHKQGGGVGCAWAMLAINAAFIGLLTVSFVQGPYSRSEQELWYRYYSLVFLVAGVVLPAIVLFAVRRARGVVIFATVWMLIVIFGFGCYAMLSGGGV